MGSVSSSSPERIEKAFVSEHVCLEEGLENYSIVCNMSLDVPSLK